MTPPAWLKPDDAFGVVDARRNGAPEPLLITCEHASNRLPHGRAFAPEDRWIEDTHWAYDLGAASLASELAHAMAVRAVLCAFSRLWADPNRTEDSDTLFRAQAEGRTIHLNREIDDGERRLRLEGSFRAYHQAVDAMVAASSASTLFSVHTFTPVYEGEARTLEVGVLFDDAEPEAAALAAALAEAGLTAALNEPYSGKEGLIYAVDRHAKSHGRTALEIEVRQDLAVDPSFRARFVPVLARSLLALSVVR